jgi:hypothetical protein
MEPLALLAQVALERSDIPKEDQNAIPTVDLTQNAIMTTDLMGQIKNSKKRSSDAFVEQLPKRQHLEQTNNVKTNGLLVPLLVYRQKTAQKTNQNVFEIGHSLRASPHIEVQECQQCHKTLLEKKFRFLRNQNCFVKTCLDCEKKALTPKPMANPDQMIIRAYFKNLMLARLCKMNAERNKPIVID